MMPVKPSGMCAQMTSCFSSEIEGAAIIGAGLLEQLKNL